MYERHSDAELDRPDLLPTERLIGIIRECLVKWEAYPGIPGSLRWARNGITALMQLNLRAMQLHEPTANDCIRAVQRVLDMNEGVDIVYIHATPAGGAHAAIVKVGTPAYEALERAYEGRDETPHDHIEPGMF